MKRDPSSRYTLALLVGDTLAIVASYLFAYYYRIAISDRPYYFEVKLHDFMLMVLATVPVWLFILAALGLYQKKTYLKNRLSETGRLFVASIIGVMFMITLDFFMQNEFFPTRTIAVYSFIFCFVFLIFERWLIRHLRRLLIVKAGRGQLRAIIVGNTENTTRLIEQFLEVPEEGYKIVAVVAGKKYLPKGLDHTVVFGSLKDAFRHATRADVIFQTDERQSEYVYKQCINRHLSYYFVPNSANFSNHLGDPEVIGSVPAILVKVTPITGSAKILKRLMDIVLGLLLVIIFAVPMFIIWLVIKLSDIKHPAAYSQVRLSLYNKKFKIHKFRTMKSEYSGLSPTDAFNKMGRPELIKEYRKNGDYLKNDPRITKIGHFLRRTSLDELPQLFNVLSGDISLVGPRALVPGELRRFGDRSLLLSVKSGLTGLAQVSGRRDISFEERRTLDLYYVQNWSIRLDLQILTKTVWVVLGRKGAE